MPTVTDTVVPGFAQCYDPRCPGYEQEEMPVLRREVQFAFTELGGDLPGIERSSVTAVGDLSLNPDTGERLVPPCPHCDGPRIASLERRPEYARVSGQDPLALLDLDQSKQVHEVQLAGAQQSAEVSELKALLYQQQAQMQLMQQELERRRGGRPRKTEEDGEA